MNLFSYIRERNIRPKLQEEIDFYSSISKSEIQKVQLEAFNQIWQGIQENVPYYKKLIEEKRVPKQITSINDFKEFPIISREYVRENIELFINKSKPADKWSSTGGSTGTPLQFPIWNEQGKLYESSIWYARSFYNIKRSDRMFRLWGHSHTLGTGLTRLKNQIKFSIGLPLIGFKRFSAYDLSEERIREAGKQIIEFKPDYIIGYSKAINILARVNEDRKSEFHRLNLKAVMGAAEGFENESDIEYISSIFGCPVGMEYGSMEANLMAHTHPDGTFKVIWRRNLIESVDEYGESSNQGRILITTLYNRAFPLIRYELGDIISGCEKNGISVYSFKEIKGRDNDFLILEDGTPIHSEGITHAIKFSEKIAAYQIRYTKDKVYTIYVRSNEKVNDDDIQEIRKRLGQVDPRLSSMKIKQVDQLKQTIAGKTNWLMEE